MSQSERTVKTLLLCKINPDANIRTAPGGCGNWNYADIYKSIYPGPKNADRKYITFGAFDAISIYDPVEDLKSEDWFSGIYSDKKKIIDKINEQVSYHPIHLISNTAQRTDAAKKLFCVVSLIYGVNSSKETEDSTGKKSTYESTILSFLRSQVGDSEDLAFEVYNAINICDAVVIWYTDDLMAVIKHSSQLNLTGLARKTYTIIGCRMNQKGEFDSSVYDRFPKREYDLRIQGSIRDYQVFRDHVHEPLKRLYEGTHKNKFQSFYSLGQDDFTILFPKMKAADVVELLKFLMTPSNGIKMAEGCWEIHTQFLKVESFDIPSTYENAPPTSILSGLYRNCLLQYEKRQALSDYPWFAAYKELLSVHANIDHHPVLYGLSYLLYDFFRVFDYYITSGGEEILNRSKENILHFIRNWSQHTEQMTRIDDLIFRGFGSTLAIYNTLPECALDFYHSFLKNFVDLLIDIDYLDRRVRNKDDYIYDFLLVPELSQRPRISALFETSALYNNKAEQSCKGSLCRDCGNNGSCWRRQLWPQKQTYLVEFPIESVYQPQILFSALVHECYHVFGDTFRLRDRRRDYMAAFLSMRSMVHLGIPEKENEQIFRGIYKRVKLNEKQKKCEMHLKQTIGELMQNIRALFSVNGVKELYEDLCHNDHSAYFLYSDAFLRQWKKVELGMGKLVQDRKNTNSFWGNVIRDCEYYFKECYADFVMMLTLKLTPKEYFNLFQKELEHITGQNQNSRASKNRMAQRIAIVAVACSKNDTSLERVWSEDKWEREINNGVDLLPIRTPVRTTFNALLGKPLSETENSLIHPGYVLKYVEDYLSEVAYKFSEVIGSLPYEQAKAWHSFQDGFCNFFRNGNFFSREFFGIIRARHEKIRKQVHPTRL